MIELELITNDTLIIIETDEKERIIKQKKGRNVK